MSTSYQKTINFNQKPYYDDFDVTKMFHRILYRPGTPVQARELNQAQTILQEQIARFGSHIFENGSVVLDGQLALDNKTLYYVKLSSVGSGFANWETNYKDQIVTGATSNTSAKVVSYTPAITTAMTGRISTQTNPTQFSGVGTKFLTEIEPGCHILVSGSNLIVDTVTSDTEMTVKSNSTVYSSVSYNRNDPATLFVRYISGSSTIDGVTTSNSFTHNENIILNGTSIATTALSTTYSAFGISSAVFVQPGIYFLDGFFVQVEEQTLLLDKYENTPTYKVGLNKVENIITSNDPTYGAELLDNSTGTTNYLAPGADRYQIVASFDKKHVNDDAIGEFIEILRVVDGQVTKHNKYPIYSEIDKTLARRTFDESGNYTVKPFSLRSKTNATDSSKLDLTISSGKAYVFGKEFESVSPTTLTIDKPRTSASVNAADTYANFGNYILVDALTGIFYTNTFEKVRLQTSSGDNIGFAKIRHLEYHSGTVGAGTAIFKMFLFDFAFDGSYTYQDIGIIGSYRSAATIPGRAEVASSGKDSDGKTVLHSANANKLVWNLPNRAIKQSSITDVSYQIRKRFGEITFSGGLATLNTGNSTMSFVGSGSLTTDAKNTYFLLAVKSVSTSDGTGLAAGSLVNMAATDSGGSRNITVSGSSVTFNIPGNSNSFAGVVDVIATVEVDEPLGQGVKQKTLVTPSTTSFIGTTDLSKGQVVLASYDTSAAITLPVSDAYEIVGIYEETDGDGTIDVNTLKTSKDRTSRFDFNNGQKDNIYDYASITLKSGQTAPTQKLLVLVKYFSHPTGDGYFTCDSYSSSGLSDGYTDIPTYISPITGEVIELRDAIDFRPKRDNYPTVDNSVVGPALPVYGGSIETDYDYYLPRIDKVYLDDKLEFGVVSSIPSLNPIEPNDPTLAMTLFTLDLPAYVYEDKQVSIHTRVNRRFTMKDIGDLSDRIRRLEYYISQNLLEQESRNQKKLSTSGVEVGKSGTLVDSFSGHSVGDVLHPKYSCSMDFIRGEMRPGFVAANVPLRDSFQTASTNVVKTGDLITLPYSEATLAKQDLASTSITVNPFDIKNFIGFISITPNSDIWMDRTTRPVVNDNTDGQNDAWQYQSNAASEVGFGSQWKDWDHLWSGEQQQTSLQTTELRRSLNSRNELNSARDIRVSDYTASRRGIGWVDSPDDDRTIIGNRVVSNKVKPFIQAIDLTVSLKSLKPTTRIYPFFDGVNVSTYCNGGSAIYTDSAGSASFTFSIPAGTFLVGNKVFRVLDNSNNTLSTATTFAECQFTSSGIIPVIDGSLVSTRPVQIRKESFQENAVYTNVFNREDLSGSVNQDWVDPLAQTIVVDAKKHPYGVFLNKVSLYFATKPTETGQPVTIQIRDIVNGIPGQKVVPFSTVTKVSNDINIPTTNDLYLDSPTVFTFDGLVYLAPGEYALTVSANSKQYSLYVAEMGSKVYGTEKTISRQPYVGTLFKAHNSGIRVPSYYQDLVFDLSYCVFDTSVTGNALFYNTGYPTTEVLMDVMQLATQELTFKPCSTAWSYKKTTNTSAYPLDSSWVSMNANENVKLPVRSTIRSVSNDTQTIQFRNVMTTSNSDVSPVIDINRLSVYGIKNVIGSTSGGVLGTPKSDNALTADCRYITKRVLLDTLSSDLRVYLTANCPPTGTIRVFYKALNSDNESGFDLASWSLMSQQEIITTTDENTFVNLEYRPYGNIGNFDRFSIMIVLLSSDTTQVPIIRDMQAVAFIAS